MPPLFLFKYLLYAIAAGSLAAVCFLCAFQDTERGALSVIALAVACIASTYVCVALYDQGALLIKYYQQRTAGRLV